MFYFRRKQIVKWINKKVESWKLEIAKLNAMLFSRNVDENRLNFMEQKIIVLSQWDSLNTYWASNTMLTKEENY